MDWMNLTPALQVLVAASFLASCALWTGVLFSVSWLTGRARMMADGPEVGGLALALFYRWALPLLVLSLALGFAWLLGGSAERLRAHWVYAIAASTGVLVVLHSVVGKRAKRVVRGSARAAHGEALRRAAILVSFGTIVALAALRTSLVP